MQFTLTTKALRRVCDSLLGGTRAVPKSSMPVLGTTKVEADERGVTFVFTDLLTHATVRESAAVSRTGTMVVAVHELVQLAAMRGVKSFCFTTDVKRRTLRVVPERDDGIEFRYDTSVPIVPEDFPSIWRLDDAKQSPFPRDKLALLLSSALRCSSKDEMRPHLAAVLMENVRTDAGATLRTVATDGHRLAVYEWDHKDPTETFKALIPSVAVSRLLGAWRKRRGHDDEAGVKVECDHKHMRVFDPGFALGVKLVEAAFPSYDQVIPSVTPSAVSFDVRTVDFRAVMGAAVAFRSQKDQQVAFWFDERERKDGKLLVSVELLGGGLGFDASRTRAGAPWESRTLSARIPATYDPHAPKTPATIRFNANYVKDVAGVVSTESVKVTINGELDPILVVENRDDGIRARHVVMPMRASSDKGKPPW